MAVSGFKRAAIAAVAGTTLLSGVATSAAAVRGGDAVSSAHHSCGKTTKSTVISLLAGSRSYLAYGLGYRIDLARKNPPLRPACTYPTPDQRSEYVWVRSRSGKQRNLGRMPKFLAADQSSLVGSMLYSVSDSSSSSNSADPAMFWWNLKTGAKGTAAIPNGFEYVGGGPHGFVLIRGTTGTSAVALYYQRINGKRTAWGTPYPSTIINRVKTGPRGLVASSLGQFKYMAYRRPGHFRSLQVGSGLYCPTLSVSSLGCVHPEDDDLQPAASSAVAEPNAEIVPLDGGAPTDSSTFENWAPALAGKTLVFVDDRAKSFSVARPHLELGPRSLAYSRDFDISYGDDPYSNVHAELIPITSAFGGAVTIDRSRKHVVELTDAKHSKRLFTVPKRDH